MSLVNREKLLELIDLTSLNTRGRTAADLLRWMRSKVAQLPAENAEPWIPTRDLKPGKDDGDSSGCVLAWHAYNGVVIAAVENVQRNNLYTHWMKVPERP